MFALRLASQPFEASMSQSKKCGAHRLSGQAPAVASASPSVPASPGSKSPPPPPSGLLGWSGLGSCVAEHEPDASATRRTAGARLAPPTQSQTEPFRQGTALQAMATPDSLQDRRNAARAV